AGLVLTCPHDKRSYRPRPAKVRLGYGLAGLLRGQAEALLELRHERHRTVTLAPEYPPCRLADGLGLLVVDAGVSHRCGPPTCRAIPSGRSCGRRPSPRF